MRSFFSFLGVVITLASCSLAYGWGGPTHAELAEILLNDPAIAPLVPASCNVDTVTDFVGEPPDSWHHPGWTMVRDRGYLTNYGGNQDWPSLDETTRVKYLIHIATDCGVPLGHSPAREVNIDSVAEAALEAQVAAWGSYPGIVGKSSFTHSETGYTATFSGTYSEVVNKFYPACLDNATWFKGTPEPWYLFGAHETDANRSAGWNGTTLGLYLGRAMLADLFLSEKPTIANANGNYAVSPGGSVTLSSAGSCDPDSITWNTSGSYTNNGGGFNCAWDLNGDGTYETTGASPKLTHAQLVSLVGYTEGKTITLRVADTDPGIYQKTATDTATIAVHSDPTADAHGVYNVYEGKTVQLIGSGSDADGGSISFAWDRNNDGTFETLTQKPTLGYAAWSPSEMGHTVVLRVTDNEGVSVTDTALVRVYSNPTVEALEEYSARPGESIQFQATGNDQDGGGITQWFWDLDNDGQYDDLVGTGSLTYEQIIAKGVASNKWNTINLKAVDNEGQVAYDSAKLCVGLPGDANGDGRVDGSDVTILASNWQAGVGNPNPTNVTWAMGDFNGDGQVDGSDVTILAGNWQYNASAAATSVPEPSMFLLLPTTIGLMVLLSK